MNDHVVIERLEWAGDGRAGTLLVLPGGHGGVFQSPLYWPTVALVEAGWDVHVARWSSPPDEREVASVAAEGLKRLATTSNPLVIGKSFGSLAAAAVSRAGVRAIWLTPLMDRPPVVEAIESGDAATLLIGGTADPSWRGPSARNGMHVLEIPGANHGLVIPSDWRRSLEELRGIVERTVVFAQSD